MEEQKKYYPKVYRRERTLSYRITMPLVVLPGAEIWLVGLTCNGKRLRHIRQLISIYGYVQLMNEEIPIYVRDKRRLTEEEIGVLRMEEALSK